MVRSAHGFGNADRPLPKGKVRKGYRVHDSDAIRQSCVVEVWRTVRRPLAGDYPVETQALLASFGAVFSGTEEREVTHSQVHAAQRERKGHKKRAVAPTFVDYWRISLKDDDTAPETMLAIADAIRMLPATVRGYVNGPIWERQGHVCIGLGMADGEAMARVYQQRGMLARTASNAAAGSHLATELLRTVYGAPFVPQSVVDSVPYAITEAHLSDAQFAFAFERTGFCWEDCFFLPEMGWRTDPISGERKAFPKAERRDWALAKCVKACPQIGIVLWDVYARIHSYDSLPELDSGYDKAKADETAVLDWCAAVLGLPRSWRSGDRKRKIKAPENGAGVALHKGNEIIDRDSLLRRVDPLPDVLPLQDQFIAYALTTSGYVPFARGNVSEVSKAKAPDSAAVMLVCHADGRLLMSVDLVSHPIPSVVVPYAPRPGADPQGGIRNVRLV